MAQYGRLQYWEDRYTNSPEVFEWYQNYIGLRPHIHTYLTPTDRILHAGSGNSHVAEHLHNDGFVKVVNVDISATVTEFMLNKTSHLTPPMEWQVMDVRQMEVSGEKVTVARKE